MNLNNIISIISLIISIIAIIVSCKQSKKTNNISLFEKKEKFYNKLSEIIDEYSILSKLKELSKAKNSPINLPNDNPVIFMIISNLGNGDLRESFTKISNDIKFLNTNKHLFKNRYIAKRLNNIISDLISLKTNLSNCITSKISEEELQPSLIKLNEILTKSKKDLLNKIDKYMNI